MQRNPYWLIFLGLIGLGILGYTIKNGVHLWHYMRMDEQTIPYKIEWSILSPSDEEYIPLARYHYIYKEKEYQGQTRWNEIFLNEWAAQEGVKRLTQSPQIVFFDSASPEISTLQHFFPFKEILYTLLLWLLGCYFVGLGYYARGELF